MAPPKKTHCPQGHPYTPENSYHHPTKGGRCCKQCHRQQARDHSRRTAALKAAPLIAAKRDGEGRWEPAIHIPIGVAMRDRRLGQDPSVIQTNHPRRDTQ